MRELNFKKMSIQKQEDTFGGWAWLVAAIPLAVQAITSCIANVKLMSSDKAEVKTTGFSAKWSNNEEKVVNRKSNSVYYAY